MAAAKTAYQVVEYTREITFATSGPMAIESVGEWQAVRVVHSTDDFQSACRIKEIELRPLLGTSDAYRTKFEVEKA